MQKEIQNLISEVRKVYILVANHEILLKVSSIKACSNEGNIVDPTSSNIVGCNMLASFEHYVG